MFLVSFNGITPKKMEEKLRYSEHLAKIKHHRETDGRLQSC